MDLWQKKELRIYLDLEFFLRSFFKFFIDKIFLHLSFISYTIHSLFNLLLSMLAISMWFYILFIVFVWGFFLIAKIHFFKFRNYWTYLVPATKFLMLALLILTILWWYFVYKLSYTSTKQTQTIEEAAVNDIY